MKSLPNDGTRIQRKKQRLMSVPLQALSLQLLYTSLYRLLYPVASITQQLPGRTTDIIKACQDVQSCILDMRGARDKIEEEFLAIYRQ